MIDAANYINLVYDIVNQFYQSGMDKDDMVSNGMLGLVHAINGFDETMGYSFVTYATPAIKREIIRGFQRAKAKKRPPPCISLDDPTFEDGSVREMADDFDTFEECQKKELYQAVNELPDKERMVIKMMYLSPLKSSARDIAEKIGCSSQTVINIKNKGLKLLREAIG